MNIWDLRSAKNVNDLLNEELRKQIGSDAFDGYTVDKQSRRDWEDRMDNGLKLALQVTEEKNSPWRGASNVKFPLITIAALQFSARGYPALVKVPDIVKYRVNGEDKDGSKATRAARISKHMSYQLLNEDEDWEEDFDKALIALPIVGTTFKKSFFDSVEGHNVSKHVLAQNLVVSYYARSIEKCERKTEEFELYDREIKERQLKGLYSNVELSQVSAAGSQKLSDKRQGLIEPVQDKKKARKLLEQHCYLDLDEDGYEEPYVVTLDKATKTVLRIVSRFADVETEQSIAIKDRENKIKLLRMKMQEIMQSLPAPNGQAPDPRALQMAEAANQSMMNLKNQIDQLTNEIKQLKQNEQQEPKVLRIEAEEHYTKYGFIPSPDGGFYDLGLGALLGPLNDSVDTLINQLIDSGTLQNGNHGFIARGGRIPGGKLRFEEPNEWIRVNVGGKTLRESLVPLPVNQPSAVLFNLLSLLINYAEKVSSVNDMMTGQNPGQNTPAYSAHAMLEQGMQVFNGIFKRLYRSFRKEVRKLYILNSVYMNPMEYFETVDGGRFEILQKDYSGDPKDCVPAADPNAFSNMEQLMKAHFLAERAMAIPGYDRTRVELLLLESMDIPDREMIFPLDERGQPAIQPAPDPEIVIKKADVESRVMERKSRQETNAALAESTMDKDLSTAVLNFAKAKQMGDKTAIDEHKAITERMKVRLDALKDRSRDSAGSD